MKKRIVSINALPYGSTGSIMQGIAREASMHGYNIAMFVSTDAYSSPLPSSISAINSKLGNRIAIYLNKLTGLEGCFAFFSTVRLIREIEKQSPDIIHLHLLHHGYINLPILFSYLKKVKKPVVWTFHDCWAFTGHCPHFEHEKCEKWKNGCYQCPRYESYPKSLYDNSKFMWRWKKEWFSNLSNLTIVTPSVWLAGLVESSFLKEYRTCTIYNGIDLSVFRPSVGLFRKQHVLEHKKIVLGVASVWNEKKGLDVFIELAKRLPCEYQIVLVGTNDSVDKTLPSNIISVHRTNDKKQLAEIYTTADVFVNPTREEVLGLVNLEALACGTPVITFSSGGSPECLDNTCGTVVACDDIDNMEKEIRKICNQNPFSAEACVKRAQEFEQKKRFREYVALYEKIIEDIRQK